MKPFFETAFRPFFVLTGVVTSQIPGGLAAGPTGFYRWNPSQLIGGLEPQPLLPTVI